MFLRQGVEGQEWGMLGQIDSWQGAVQPFPRLSEASRPVELREETAKKIVEDGIWISSHVISVSNGVVVGALACHHHDKMVSVDKRVMPRSEFLHEKKRRFQLALCRCLQGDSAEYNTSLCHYCSTILAMQA